MMTFEQRGVCSFASLGAISLLFLCCFWTVFTCFVLFSLLFCAVCGSFSLVLCTVFTWFVLFSLLFSGVLCQPLDSPSLRIYLGLQAFPQHTGNGVLVNKVLPLSSVSTVLQERDVLLAYNGEAVGCDGTVHFRGHERTSFDWLVTASKIGTEATLTILRDREEMEVTCVLNEGKPLVPVHNYDKLPSYFIIAGFVFSTLTQPYLHE